MLKRLILAAIAAACLMFVVEGDNGLDAHASTSLVAAVRADLGTNPTGWKRLWCAQYLRQVLNELGFRDAYRKTNARAVSFLNLTRSPAKVGAIAVMTRKRGGHVCTVTAVLKKTFRCIGGNQGKKYAGGDRRVSENVYPMKRVVAFVVP